MAKAKPSRLTCVCWVQMRKVGITTLPCAALQGAGASIAAAWQQVLEGKAASLLAAARLQEVQPMAFKPRGNAFAKDVFIPLSQLA